MHIQTLFSEKNSQKSYGNKAYCIQLQQYYWMHTPIYGHLVSTTRKKIPSYMFLKDITDFLKRIETTKLSEKYLFVSIDVSSLYTNIPHEDGKQSILYDLQANPDTYTQPEPLPEI